MRSYNLMSFNDSWSGQLCSSKDVDCVVEASLIFVKKWIKFLYHRVPTLPTGSVFPGLSFLNLSVSLGYSSIVADDSTVYYATM